MPRAIGKTEKKLSTVKRLATRRGVSANSTDVHLPPYVTTGENDTLNDKFLANLQRQIYYEYNLDWNFMRPKIQKWLQRLKLYNNQRRDEDKVGEPLIYDTHQTVMSILTGDKLNVEFGGRVEGEEDQAENLNTLSENDFDEMRKEELDYEWNWDAGFFGSGLCLMNDFDTDSKTPIPSIIDPTTFIRNPGAKWINGNRAGEGALLYGGYEVRLTESMMRSNPRTATNPNGYFNLNALQKTNDLFSLSGEASRLRREAQGMNDIYTFENTITENYEYSVLRWFTHVADENGISSKYIIEVANNRLLPIRVIKLKRDWWPIIHRKFSPIAHDWDGVSIPDLTEDKQRFKATVLNDLGDVVKSEVKPMHLFHEDRFRKTQDFTIKWGKWLPVKGSGPLSDAAMTLQGKQISPLVMQVLNYLDQSAQKAFGTPDVQQGQSAPGSQTLGEVQTQVQGAGNRHSLTAKIFGWSEKEFWRQWYFVYEEFFDDSLGAKMLTLEGLFNATKWIPIKRSSIITGNTLGPKIKIESRSNAEAKNIREFQMMQGWAQMVVMDPTVQIDKTYLYREMGKRVIGRKKVEAIIPYSVDERTALEENKKLNDEEMPKVLIAQDHNVHLRVHAAADDNPTTRRHIQLHIFMLMQKRSNPTAFPQLPGERSPGNQMTPSPSQTQNPAAKVQTPAPTVAQPSSSPMQ